jgi:hypothetical protein
VEVKRATGFFNKYGDGFLITIFDNRSRGDNSKPRLERVVVAGE